MTVAGAVVTGFQQPAAAETQPTVQEGPYFTDSSNPDEPSRWADPEGSLGHLRPPEQSGRAEDARGGRGRGAGLRMKGGGEGSAGNRRRRGRGRKTPNPREGGQFSPLSLPLSGP